MKRIGLTGNIGTGKSTVALVFQVLGVPVYHADIQARLILESDHAKEVLATLFGSQIFNSQQQVDRKALATIVFSDKEKLKSLNSLVHPMVEKDFSLWCVAHQEKKYIIHEAAILFESGFDRLFDAIIMVTAPEELCIARVMSRDGITREMVIDRIRNQWPQNKKQELSDYRVVNDEISMIIPQILTIHQNILDS